MAADSLDRPRLPPPDPTRRAPQVSDSGLDKPVAFSASDSLVILLNEDTGDEAHMIGNALVTYGEATLSAYRIDLFFDRDELRAEGLVSDTGRVGTPRFEQGTETFSGLQLMFNMKSERGRVVGAQTQMEDGFIRADVAKVREDSTLFIAGGSYTTCDCGPDETPSYSLRSHKMKIVDQKWIYTGPIQLYIFNIPTPLILPFGFLPAQEGRRSGPLPPEYGEDQRGFYLRNWGWYWAINDYTDLQTRVGIWTLGSWQINPSFRYRKRDSFDGGLSVDYLRERSGEKDDPDLAILNRFSLRWSHNQTLNPTARLTGNVNLSSSGYLRAVSDQYNDNVRQSISSSIQYNKRFSGGRSLSLNMSQNQILATGSVDLTLPEVRFNQSSTTPFKRRGRSTGGDGRWYERITVSYTGRLNNRYSFQPLPEETLIANGDSSAVDISWYDALFDGDKYRRATGDEVPFEFTASHRIPISAPFAVNRLPIINKTFRLNLSPNFSYSEDWYVQTERRMADSTNRVVVEQDPGFFALRQFNTGVSANTTFYGIFPVGVGPYRGVRHTVRPSVSFTYRPDFSADVWGYTRTYTDTSGTEVTYNRVRGVPTGKQQALSFSLGNVFETKRVQTDSTGEETSRTQKLLDLSLSTNYNFAADSLKLSDVQLTARTRVLGKLTLNMSSTFSPYTLDAAGTRRLNRYVFDLRRVALARLTRLSLTGNFSLRSGGSGGSSRPVRSQQAFSTAATSSLGTNDPFGGSPYGDDVYTDFSIPWDLDVRFSYSYSKPLSASNRSFTVNTTFDFGLTPRWRIRGQSGYDFERKEIVTTALNLFRDFECWEMSFRWVPFGQFQSWGFDLHVKSGHLRDFLRIRQPRSERDRGFGL